MADWCAHVSETSHGHASLRKETHLHRWKDRTSDCPTPVLLGLIQARAFISAMRVVERVGWVERSDTHRNGEDDGFREGLNPSYGLISPNTIAGFP